MDNPLLKDWELPPFSAIQPAHIEPALDRILDDNRRALEALLAQDHYTWDNLVAPLEAMGERLNRMWAPVRHLHAVADSEPLRRAYQACLPKLSAYATEMGQNERLYQAYRTIAEGPEYARLTPPQKKVIDDALRDFRLAGVHLPEGEKARYKAIQAELSALTNRFENNILDATHRWQKPIGEEALAGLPGFARALLKQNAERKGLEGWLITLDFPSYHAVMTYAEDRALRKEVHEAYVTRAADVGPHDKNLDNTETMERILALRHELARITGFPHYAERSLATKMAADPHQVVAFLRDLARRALPRAKQEIETLKAFSGLPDFHAWDVAYYSEKLRKARFDLSQEELKPYFPESQVISGLFEIAGRLFGLSFEERKDVEVWHEDVRFFEIFDETGERRGAFYLDLYARPGKRGGAWMDECQNRTGERIPVAFLTCNLSPPVGDKPALFTHDEVITLFHEFGHGLHHMLTRIDIPSIAGINGVPWDAVELPSQFMENFCWEREGLDLIARHVDTGAPLPGDLYRKLRESRGFQAGMQMVRQLEFALFDMRLHMEYDGETGARIQELLDEVREEVAVVPIPDFNRFQHSFSHIFAGGYAAGYYSYKWAEVLSADAFSLFEEKGIFDANTGRRFMLTILEKGGSEDPMVLFKAFRGREPKIDALLRHSGLMPTTPP